ncbi:Uncharacterised protein [Mycobacteroides abscessus subsp. bolletii]|uniref:hypothetical protein n=1 Tax=Mycobacteroides abscessus TaxID=36809 RepID=UPI0009A6AE4E|nr:hypothetical protein [Mycobacteroides abscessus]SKV05537.1 Uncharacterised protein [Mycobacteroides abscessus subsp. bolletii]
MLDIKIGRAAAAGVLAVGAFALSACGTDDSGSTDYNQMNTSVQVKGHGPGWGSDEFEGTVSVDAGPTCATADDGRVVVFHVSAGASKGAIPTANWRLQTGNVQPVKNGKFDLGSFGGPLLGSPVDNDHAWGDIVFAVPPRTVPTALELFGDSDSFSSSGPGKLLARWATPYAEKTTAMCTGELLSVSTAPTTTPAYPR